MWIAVSKFFHLLMFLTLNSGWQRETMVENMDWSGRLLCMGNQNREGLMHNPNVRAD